MEDGMGRIRQRNSVGSTAPVWPFGIRDVSPIPSVVSGDLNSVSAISRRALQPRVYVVNADHMKLLRS